MPKDKTAVTILYFNKEGFSSHCRDYLQYQDWLANRNTQRFVEIENHNQQIDGINLLHCRRLLDMAIEIATEKTIKVRRENAEELLKIRRGEIDLEQFIAKAEEEIENLEELFQKSNLPDEVDPVFVNELLLKVRKNLEHGF